MPPLRTLTQCSTGARQLPVAMHRQWVASRPAGYVPLRTPATRASVYGLRLKAAHSNQQPTQETTTLPIQQAGCSEKAHTLSTQPVEQAPVPVLDQHTLAMIVALLCTTVTALLEPSAADAAETAASGLMSAGLPASMLVLAAASTSSANIDFLGLLLHNPILAAVVAVGALVLIPRLIQFSINVLAVPAMVIFVVYLAASHPDTTQAALTGIFRWVFDHPVITSGAILVVATVLLLPSLIVGAGALGAVVLLSQVVAPDFAPTDTSSTTEISTTRQAAGQLTDGTTSATTTGAVTPGQQQSSTGAVVQATDAGSTGTAAGSSSAAPAQPKGPLDGLVSKYKVLSALKIVPALPQELTQLPSELPKVAPRPAALASGQASTAATAATAATATAKAPALAAAAATEAAPSSAASNAVLQGLEAAAQPQQAEVPQAAAAAVSAVPEQAGVPLEQPTAAQGEQPAPTQQPAAAPAVSNILSGATLLTLPAAAADLQPASAGDAPSPPDVMPTVDLAAGGEEVTDRLTEILERS